MGSRGAHSSYSGDSGYELIAVATSRQETASQAARAFGLNKGYGSGAELIQDPEIDIVTVATRVPDHRELLLSAIAAGKHVYSEWPLAVNTHDAREIANAARKAGIRHAIGLQLRCSPAVRQAQHLLADNAIGRLLSIRTYSTTAGFGPDVPGQFAYQEEPAHFANLVTIQGAHTLDLVMALGGPLVSMAALPSRQYPEVQMGDPRQPATRRTFDHLLMQGRLASGVPFSLEVGGGHKHSTPFYLEITGENGTLRLEGGAPRGVQSSRLRLLHNGELQGAGKDSLNVLSEGGINVAGIYGTLRDNIVRGTSTVPDFNHAVQLTQLIEDILASPVQKAQDIFEAWPKA